MSPSASTSTTRKTSNRSTRCLTGVPFTAFSGSWLFCTARPGCGSNGNAFFFAVATWHMRVPSNNLRAGRRPRCKTSRSACTIDAPPGDRHQSPAGNLRRFSRRPGPRKPARGSLSENRHQKPAGSRQHFVHLTGNGLRTILSLKSCIKALQEAGARKSLKRVSKYSRTFLPIPCRCLSRRCRKERFGRLKQNPVGIYFPAPLLYRSRTTFFENPGLTFQRRMVYYRMFFVYSKVFSSDYDKQDVLR